MVTLLEKKTRKTYLNSGWFKTLSVLILAFFIFKFYEKRPEGQEIREQLHEAKAIYKTIKERKAPTTQQQKKLEESSEVLKIASEHPALSNAVIKYLIPQIQDQIQAQIGSPQNATRQKVIDFVTGTGPEVICGHSVSLHYEMLTDTQRIMQSSKSKPTASPLQIQIGDGTLSPFIEHEIIGMQQGGWRQIALPAARAFNNDTTLKNYLSTNIELFSVSPKDAPNLETIQIFDKVPGRGDLAICGAIATIQYTIKSAQNKIIASTKNTPPAIIYIGKNEHIIGLENSIIGMRKGGIRTAIVPEELNIHWNAPETNVQTIPSDIKGNIIIDLELLDITMPENKLR